jgi:hypothetical protein
VQRRIGVRILAYQSVGRGGHLPAKVDFMDGRFLRSHYGAFP